MAGTQLPPDLSEFLKLLNAHGVEYLLIGGYAVSYYGYARATADMDIWIAVHSANASHVVDALVEFGFNVPELSPDLFLDPDKIVRFGQPPMRIEILTSISGVRFEHCFDRRVAAVIGDVPVNLISLQDLKTNKAAAGRYKENEDLEHLP